ncbi:MAG: tol-pal system protein YbgF [Proteobacteria bacterium]|nr:tol-pal system protein YbgF [Pseudomonadota bacterium]
MKNALIALLVAAVSLASSSAAAAKVEDRVTALEHKVITMQNTRLANDQEVASSVARLNAMQDDFASLKGDVDANKYFINSRSDELSRQMQSLENRLQAIEDRLALFSTQLSKALSKLAPEVAGEGEMYQKGLDLVSTANYLEAASTFSSFMQKYPKSSFVPSAMFWIADCYYSAGDHRRAIKEFQAFVEKYSRSDKVPEAILKQGNSFYALNMYDESRAFYDKVLASYPKSAAAAQARERIDRMQRRKTEAQAAPAGASLGSYPEQTLEQKMRRNSAPPSDLAPEKQKSYRKPPGDF